MYRQGLGLPIDEQKTVYWFVQAAHQQNQAACLNLVLAVSSKDLKLRPFLPEQEDLPDCVKNFKGTKK
jgi:TPR repeat protein